MKTLNKNKLAAHAHTEFPSVNGRGVTIWFVREGQQCLKCPSRGSTMSQNVRPGGQQCLKCPSRGSQQYLKMSVQGINNVSNVRPGGLNNVSKCPSRGSV